MEFYHRRVKLEYQGFFMKKYMQILTELKQHTHGYQRQSEKRIMVV